MRFKWLDELADIEAIISRCDACHLAMVDENQQPYVVPMNFGYENQIFYFHGDQHGKKMSCLKNNPLVSISLSTDHRLFNQNEDVACSYGMEYSSVVLSGRAEFINDFAEKEQALQIIMKQYTNHPVSFNAPAVQNVAVFKVLVNQMRGKLYRRFLK